jgi:hypothetical protein
MHIAHSASGVSGTHVSPISSAGVHVLRPLGDFVHLAQYFPLRLCDAEKAFEYRVDGSDGFLKHRRSCRLCIKGKCSLGFFAGVWLTDNRYQSAGFQLGSIL